MWKGRRQCACAVYRFSGYLWFVFAFVGSFGSFLLSFSLLIKAMPDSDSSSSESSSSSDNESGASTESAASTPKPSKRKSSRVSSWLVIDL